MTEATIRRPFPPRRKRALTRRDPNAPRIENLYPLQMPLIIVGIGLGIVTGAFLDWVAGFALFSLLALVGASWRADMPPLFSACIAYQWIFASSAYFWYALGGLPDHTIEGAELAYTLVMSMLGLGALTAGLRLMLRIFSRQILALTTQPPTRYRLVRVFWLTIAAFAVNYLVYLVPSQIWFGGAQIINTLLLLRFVPYFLLVVSVFERRSGYQYLAVATVWVIAPEFLTGFSTFREILFVVLIAALAQWRPWVQTRDQSRRNRQIVVFGVVGFLLIAALGLIWSGGMKQAWREKIWAYDAVASSPLKRMGDFVSTFGDVATSLDLGLAANSYAERISSASYYFALVGRRVPQTVNHERGTLLMMAIKNATTPRFLFEDKAVVESDSWLVRKYAGVQVSGAESGTSVALGYMAEFYIDFGIAGVLVLSLLWGAIAGFESALLATSAPSREIFLTLLVGLFIQSYMGFDGSFIKLLAGNIMRTGITYLFMLLAGNMLNKWLMEGGKQPPSSSPERKVAARPLPGRLSAGPLRVR